MRTSAYYSPGVCPEDWTTVQRRTTRGETTHNCCPSGFTVDTSLCRSAIRTTTTEAILYYQETRASENPQVFTVTANDIVWATGIEVRFKDGDLSSTSGSSRAAETTTSETTSKTEAPNAAETGAEDTKGDTSAEGVAGGGTQDHESHPSGNSGLSNGAKIGIGIGVPLAAIALGALAFLLWWRRRRAKTAAHPAHPAAHELGAPQMVMAEASGYDASGHQYAPVPITTYGDDAYGAKHPATDTFGELYAPDAHGGYAQHQRPLSEVQGSSPEQTYTGTSPGLTPGSLSPTSGVTPSQSPQQLSAGLAPGQQQAPEQAQYQPYQTQPHQVHEIGGNSIAPNSNAGPLPDHHELYPETVDGHRGY